MTRVDPATDIRDFFQHHIHLALQTLQVTAEHGTDGYLVQLLSDFAAVPDVPPLDAPLASVLAWALEVDGLDRTYRMRALGDLALFRCGFFPGILERRGVSEAYASEVGGRAYGEVASRGGVAQPSRPTGRKVFRILAARFTQCVRIIEHVREQTVLTADAGRLLERFYATGSPLLLDKLHRAGLVVPAMAGGADN